MQSDELHITKESDGENARFILSGRVSLTNAPQLQFQLEDALKKGEKNIILNMFQVAFLSSAGIRVILKIHQKASDVGGRFGIEDPSENVSNVIGMTALDELLV